MRTASRGLPLPALLSLNRQIHQRVPQSDANTSNCPIEAGQGGRERFWEAEPLLEVPFAAKHLVFATPGVTAEHRGHRLLRFPAHPSRPFGR